MVLCRPHDLQGYFVSLVPPESYLDVTTSQFSRSLLFNYPNEYPSFYYHGHNAYAYWLARYGSTNVTAADGSASVVPTYDWISIQLYESYSHALYNTTVLGQSASDYLEAWVPRVYDGWRVDFSSDPTVNWPTQHVRVNQTQLIVGLANGWTDGTRAILIWPALVCEAYNNLAAKGQQPRGFMFWVSATGSDTGSGSGSGSALALESNARGAVLPAPLLVSWSLWLCAVCRCRTSRTRVTCRPAPPRSSTSRRASTSACTRAGRRGVPHLTRVSLHACRRAPDV